MNENVQVITSDRGAILLSVGVAEILHRYVCTRCAGLRRLPYAPTICHTEHRQFEVALYGCGGARGSEFVRIMPMMPSLIYTYFSPLSVLSNCDEHIIHENVAKRATKSTRGR